MKQSTFEKIIFLIGINIGVVLMMLCLLADGIFEIGMFF
jgi:hypothetical protein